MNNLTFNNMKDIYYNYFILIVIIIFVTMYIVLNYNKVIDNNYSAQDFVKPTLITCIIILICNLVVFSDNENDDLNSSDANIVQYVKNDIKDQRVFKILNDNNKGLEQNENLNNKNSREIKITNDNVKKKEQKLIKKNNDSDYKKYLNKNIFLPFKQNKKFQLKT